jgi:hypothetical protein
VSYVIKIRIGARRLHLKFVKGRCALEVRAELVQPEVGEALKLGFG